MYFMGFKVTFLLFVLGYKHWIFMKKWKLFKSSIMSYLATKYDLEHTEISQNICLKTKSIGAK